MSRWRALAAVDAIPAAERVGVLTDALEALLHVCDALDLQPLDAWAIGHDRWLESIVEGAAERQAEAARANDDDDDDDDTDRRSKDEIRARLETELRKTADLEEELAGARQTIGDLAWDKAALTEHAERYSDLLSMARRFVAVGEASGFPVKHARSAGGGRRKKTA